MAITITRKNNKVRVRRTNKRQSHKKPKLVVYGKIYANWCGHCRSMEMDWKILEKKMLPVRSANIESEEKDAKVAEFNKTHRTNLALQNGFPTIFRLKKVGGSVEYYQGGDRSEASLRKWLRGK